MSTNITSFKKHLRVVLTKLCDIVDVDVNEIDFSKDDWFMQKTWDEHQERYFKEWMIDYLIKNKSARKELLTSNCNDSIYISAIVSLFMLNYSWSKGMIWSKI